VAVAFDAEVENVRIGTSDPWTWTHTPAGTPRAVIVSIVHGTSSTDHVVSVTYGAVAMTRIVRATDTATEPGAAELWFLGAGIPSGAQTVSVDLASATTDDLQGVSTTLTAADNTKVIDFDSISENAANPTVTLQKGDRTGISLCAMYGGGGAPGGTLATGNTLGPTEDLGAFYAQTCRETTVDSADHTIGWSTLTSDDLAFVALCVSEVETFTGVVSRTTTAGITVAGTRTTFGQASQTTTASITTAGVRKVFGATSLTVTAQITTNGIRTATAATSLTTTAQVTTAGTRATFGQVSRTTAAGIQTAGTRTTFGAASLTTAVGIVTAGARQVFGAASLTVTVAAATAGTRSTFGAASLTETAAVTTAGTRKTFGASSVTVTVTTATVGTRKTFGSTSLTATFAAQTAGLRTTFGSTSLTGTFTITTAGDILGGYQAGDGEIVAVSFRMHAGRAQVRHADSRAGAELR